jgi:hypothetical protein
MALIYLDSFAGYTTATIPLRYESVINTFGTIGIYTASTSSGGVIPRTGTQMLGLNASTAAAVGKLIPGSVSTVIQGAAIYDTNNNVSHANTLFTIFDAGGNPVIALFASFTGALYVYALGIYIANNYSSSSVLIAQAPAGTLPRSAWTMVEWKVTTAAAASATGSVAVYVSGVQVINVTNVVTTITPATATMGLAYLGNALGDGPGFQLNTINSGQVFYNDFYMFDTTGSVNNAPAGDVRVEAMLPNAPGRVAAWTPTSGANWTNVDSIPPSTTASVSSATVGATDAYALSSIITAAPSVKAVQASAYASKSDAGVRTLGVGVGNGTTENLDGGHGLLTTPRYYERPMDINPLTGVAWTSADLATLQAAIQVIT